MDSDQRDAKIRSAMFLWLEQMAAIHGDVLPRSLLLEGFPFEGGSISALHPAGRGIWKPKGLDTALSLTTTVGSPYDDHFSGDRLAYSYQGNNPGSSDNCAVRSAKNNQIPLAYFHAVMPGRYCAFWPVLVIGDDSGSLRFWVQVEPAGVAIGGATILGSVDGSMISNDVSRRAYGTSVVKTRLHQRGFRERVLSAYQSCCAMCRLKHRELLDAAHIIPDKEGGEPVVSNGIALCKIHHAAFDKRVIGVNPDGYRIAVREDVLREVDGPMLRHGIQEMEGRKLWVPRSAAKKPDLEALAVQWQRFRDVG